MKVFLVIAAVVLPFAVEAMSLVGGVKKIDVDLKDEKIGYASKAINDKLLMDNANAVERPTIRVISATQQIVSGVLYRFTLEMGGEPSHQICDIELQVQSWLPNKYTVRNIKCQTLLGGDDHDKVPHGKTLLGGDDHDKVPHGKTLLGGDDHDKVPHGGALLGEDDHDKLPHGNGGAGGHHQISCDEDDIVKQALVVVIERANAAINSAYRVIPTGCTATRQVVNGLVFRFKDIELHPTTCRNTMEFQGKLTIEECPLAGDSNTNFKKASAKVYWDRSAYEIQEFALED